MKKFALPLIIVIAVVAVAAFLTLNKPTQTPTSNQPNPTKTTQQSSLMDLFKSGTNLVCTINREGNTGTVKIANGKSRVDLTTTAGNKTIDSHVIVDGEYTYMWNSDSKDGFKIKTPNPDQANTASQSGQFDLNQKVDFDCQPWTVDTSVFNQPSDIKFTDLGSMIKETSGSVQKMSASVCDSITDPTAKAACQSALSK